MANLSGEPDIVLDILGQQPGLQIYTQIIVALTHPSTASDEYILDKLNNGRTALAEAFPWTAGQVVNEGKSDGDSGVFKIKPLANTPGLVVKDLRHDRTRSLAVLQEAQFPARLLHEDIVAPRRTIPTANEGNVTPVFMMQTTFCPGALLLTFVGHHCVMDMTGLGQVIRLFSKACAGEAFTEEDVKEGNRDRELLLDALMEDAKQVDVEDQILPSTEAIATDKQPWRQPETPPACSWVNFHFTAESLRALKKEASATLPPHTPFVSSDDALTAFVWQSVTRARSYRLDPSTRSTLGRAVDTRRYLGISDLYPGLLNNLVYKTHTISSLVAMSLGHLAAELRSALMPIDATSSVAQRTLAMAAYLKRTKDKSSVSFTAAIDPSTGIALSSWAKEQMYDLDFGLGLGKPVAVRRPAFVPFEGLIYFMPRAKDGGIVVMICLREDDLASLGSDEEWKRYASFIR
jgi:trichothecene 3-O-acetyltransferase